MSPLLRMSTWEKIREQFSQAEKDELNEHIVGQVICPQGCTLDLDALSPELRRKLEDAVSRAD